MLNYMVTSNQFHLLVKDNGERAVIPNPDKPEPNRKIV